MKRRKEELGDNFLKWNIKTDSLAANGYNYDRKPTDRWCCWVLIAVICVLAFLSLMGAVGLESLDAVMIDG